MEEAFKTFLMQHDVDPQIIAYLALPDTGCFSVEHFANWVDNKSELDKAILALTPCRGNPSQLARLRQAWRKADSNVSRGIKRSAEGLPNEDLDSPLDEEIYKSRVAIFQDYYKWQRIDIRRLGSDSLMGRITREFDRRQPSMFSISRVRCLARSQRASAPKRERIADRVVLEIPDDDDYERKTSGLALRDFFQELDIMCKHCKCT